jgi:hypothetical protein
MICMLGTWPSSLSGCGVYSDNWWYEYKLGSPFILRDCFMSSCRYHIWRMYSGQFSFIVSPLYNIWIFIYCDCVLFSVLSPYSIPFVQKVATSSAVPAKFYQSVQMAVLHGLHGNEHLQMVSTTCSVSFFSPSLLISHGNTYPLYFSTNGIYRVEKYRTDNLLLTLFLIHATYLLMAFGKRHQCSMMCFHLRN